MVLNECSKFVLLVCNRVALSPERHLDGEVNLNLRVKFDDFVLSIFENDAVEHIVLRVPLSEHESNPNLSAIR